MKQIKDMLIAHLNKHPPDFGMYDAGAILDFLYTSYCEAHDTDPPKVRALFTELGEYLESLPREQRHVLHHRPALHRT